MEGFSLIKISRGCTTYRNSKGQIFTEGSARLVGMGLIEFFSIEDAQKIVQSSGLQSGAIFSRLSGSSLWVPISRMNYLPFFVVMFAMALAFSLPMDIRNVVIGPFKEESGILIFPLSFIFTDLVNELFGYQFAKRMIRYTAMILVVLAGLIQMTVHLDSTISRNIFSGTFSSDEIVSSFMVIYSDLPKVMLVVALAILIADTFNAYTFTRIKSLMHGKRLWLRSLLSTLFGQIAFTLTWMAVIYTEDLLMLKTWWVLAHSMGFKLIYTILTLPLVYITRSLILHKERQSHPILPPQSLAQGLS